MIVLENHAPVAPLDLSTLIKRQKLSAPDRKELDAAVAEITRVLAKMNAHRPDSQSFTSPLHLAADEAERALAADPSDANLEACNAADDALRAAESRYKRIGPALDHACRVKIDSLRAVAERILDATEADLESEGSKRRAEIIAADAVFGEGSDAAEFDARLARTRVLLAEERQAIRAQGASLSWLSAKGFCGNPYLATVA
jgi:hypothetical protein